MAPPGPKPKPRRLKVLEGTWRADRDPGGIDLPPGAPAEPSWTKILPGKNSAKVRADAQATWRRYVPELDRVGLLAHVDRDLLVDLCVCVAQLADCERSISIEGKVIAQEITRKDGSTYIQRVRHPLSVTAKEYRGSIDKYRGELGLGPGSRGRLNIPGRGDDAESEERAVFNT